MYDMIRYDIYLLELGFHPVAVVSKLVQKQDRDSYDSYIQMRNNTQNNTETQNTQNRKHTK